MALPRLPATPLGTLLRAARAASGLSTDAAARALSVSPNTIRAWERGSAEPSYTSLRAIVALYTIDPRALLSA